MWGKLIISLHLGLGLVFLGEALECHVCELGSKRSCPSAHTEEYGKEVAVGTESSSSVSCFSVVFGGVVYKQGEIETEKCGQQEQLQTYTTLWDLDKLLIEIDCCSREDFCNKLRNHKNEEGEMENTNKRNAQGIPR